MKSHLENIPASPIVYMRRTGAYGEQNYKLMQDMKDWIRGNNLWGNDGIIYGIAQDNAAMTPHAECRYDICFVTEKVFEDNTIQNGTILSGLYLVFEEPHTAEEVGAFWASIGKAVARDRKQIDESRPILERYQFALVENGYCEFCVPMIA